MTLLTFGKHKNEVLETTPESYIKWLATHRGVLSAEHKVISDKAKEILEYKEKAHKLNEARFASAKRFKALKAESDARRTDLGLIGNLKDNRAFSILR
jgi:hypothetical protein